MEKFPFTVLFAYRSIGLSIKVTNRPKRKNPVNIRRNVHVVNLFLILAVLFELTHNVSALGDEGELRATSP
jgi:hypothetical protein